MRLALHRVASRSCSGSESRAGSASRPSPPPRANLRHHVRRPQLALEQVLARHGEQHHRHPVQPVVEHDDVDRPRTRMSRRLAVRDDLAEHAVVGHRRTDRCRHRRSSHRAYRDSSSGRRLYSRHGRSPPVSRTPLRPRRRRSRARDRAALRRDLPPQQTALYDRSPHNVVRIEYGEHATDDGPRQSLHARSERSRAWTPQGVLHRSTLSRRSTRYTQRFAWGGKRTRACLLRRSCGSRSGRRASSSRTSTRWRARRPIASSSSARLRTQVSPVYSLYRRATNASPHDAGCRPAALRLRADGQRHMLSASPTSTPSSVRAATSRRAASTSPTAIIATRPRSHIATSAAPRRRRAGPATSPRTSS